MNISRSNQKNLNKIIWRTRRVKDRLEARKVCRKYIGGKIVVQPETKERVCRTPIGGEIHV
jgi:hypothetical protein